MSKEIRKKKKRAGKPKSKAPETKPTFSILRNTKWVMGALMLFSILLYANTIGHDYTQDDAIVIYDNMYTTQGVKGIPGLLTKDTFFGFFKTEGKAKLVSGGRYRPLTPIMFALEWQLFGRSPWVGHLINILLYGILGIIIYLLIKRITLRHYKSIDPFLFSALTAFFFIAHPVHTEVIANIKGRDEILSLLGSILSLYWLVKSYHTKNFRWALLAGACFFLALLSKENAIMFMAIAPLTLYFLMKVKFRGVVRLMWPMALACVIFLLIRTSVLGLDFGGAPQELMNNPFLKAENQQYVPFDADEKIATISYTLGNYIRLMFFPHPLTHDYYPRHIEIMNFGNWQVWLSIIGYIILFFASFYYRRRHPWVSYGIWFFLISLFIVSNILFPIGTNMSERFLFMASLGLILSLSYIISMGFKSKKLTLPLVLVVGLGLLSLSAKTILRNPVWKNDFTLFTTDVHTSNRSAKLLNAAGGALSNEALKPGNEEKRNKMLNDAISYLKQAIDIHPTYKNAYLILGNCYHHLKQYEKALKYYEITLRLDPGYKDALQNIGVNYRELGRYYGQEQNNPVKAIEFLEKAYKYRPTEYETVRLLGIANGRSGRHAEAVRYFEEAIKINPNLAGGYSNLGNAYLNLGQGEKAREMFNKALAIDPNALNRN